MIQFSSTGGWYVIGFGFVAVFILGLVAVFLQLTDNKRKENANK